MAENNDVVNKVYWKGNLAINMKIFRSVTNARQTIYLKATKPEYVLYNIHENVENYTHIVCKTGLVFQWKKSK